jgi:hypothetical protein
MLEFDRALLYLVVLCCFGSFARTSRYVRWLVWGVAIALVVICTAGFITRTLPDFWSAPPDLQRERLSYPIGYWNALGLAAAIGLVLCLHITSSAREPGAARVLAAGACPVLGATLLLTFSRGPMVVAAGGLIAYMILGRPRLLLTGFLASVPTTALAILVAYRADRLAEFVPGTGYRFSQEAVQEGHDVALIVGLCAVGAAVVRVLGMLVADGALQRLRLRRRTRRRLALAAGALVAVGLCAGAVALARGDWLDTQYQRLVKDPVRQTGDYRDRLLNPGLNRIDRWEVALDAFSAHPLTGNGAGTYRLLWEQNRPTAARTDAAHSLYLETMAELGLVGIALLATFLVTLIVCLAVRLRGQGRALYAAILATVVVWGLNAALDWFWELPAVTLWVFAAGGAVLAVRPEAHKPRRLGLPIRLALAGGLLALMITPARVALSQGRLTDGVKTLNAGDCPAAAHFARESLSALGNRPEPYEILGYCQAGGPSAQAAVRDMRAAVVRDPDNWRFHYGLALVTAAAGEDPRAEARAAQRLNPREGAPRRAVRDFKTTGPKAWKRAATTIGLSPP